jgi:hypothetical protein
MPRQGSGSNASPRRKPPDGGRLDLVIRVALVGCLWLMLHVFRVSEGVAIATIVAVFGPDVLRVGIDFFSAGP